MLIEDENAATEHQQAVIELQKNKSRGPAYSGFHAIRTLPVGCITILAA